MKIFIFYVAFEKNVCYSDEDPSSDPNHYVLQGAVEGPSEFAEGMAIGVRSVFSGVVGGAAGTVSRITGALGKGLASLTFDEKFQKKRRETIKRRHDGGCVLFLANACGGQNSAAYALGFENLC